MIKHELLRTGKFGGLFNTLLVHIEVVYGLDCQKLNIDKLNYLTYTVFTLTWHGAAQHDTIEHGPRLHTIIIWEVGWAF